MLRLVSCFDPFAESTLVHQELVTGPSRFFWLVVAGFRVRRGHRIREETTAAIQEKQGFAAVTMKSTAPAFASPMVQDSALVFAEVAVRAEAHLTAIPLGGPEANSVAPQETRVQKT